MKKKDRLFTRQDLKSRSFEFNQDVADVFDDMAERSIPFYKEVQSMLSGLVKTFYQPGTLIYDLGCSTGTSCLNLAKSLQETGPVRIVGVDSSQPMCRNAREKLAKLKGVEIICNDILSVPLNNASIVLLNYTLQFVPPLKREGLLKHIYSSLTHNGCLIVSDKTMQSHTDISRVFVDKYYEYKRRRGYSEMEIAAKRETLENILVPYTIDNEISLFRRAGFESADIFFSWYNFTSFVCVKRGV